MPLNARRHRIVIATLALVALLLSTGCGRPEVSAHGAHVTDAKHPKLSGGERCRVRVEDAYKFGLNCRINVVCGGHQLYGGKRLGGYALCELGDDDTAVFSLEPNPSNEDGDPAIEFDRAAGSVRVWDKRWSVTATLTSAGTQATRALASAAR